MPRNNEPITKVQVGGKTRYKVVTDVPGSAGSRKQVRKTFATKKEAKAWLAAIRTAVASGTYLGPSKLTVSQAVDDWLDSKATEVRPTTLYGYRAPMRNLADIIGHMRVQDVRYRDVQLVRDTMVARGVGQRSTALMLTLTRQMFNWLIRNDVLASNPATGLPATGRAPSEASAFTPEALAGIYSAITGHPFEAGFRFTLFGLRRSEVLGLRWDDIDLDAGTVAIRRSRTTVGGTRRSGVSTAVGATKTRKGTRTLPLDDATIAVLSSLRVVQAEIYGLDSVRDGFLIVNELGQPLRPERYSDEWKAMLESAGIPYLDLRAARRSSVTAMRMRGVPDALVAKFHGHDEYVMQHYYTVIDGSDLVEAQKVLTSVLRGVS